MHVTQAGVKSATGGGGGASPRPRGGIKVSHALPTTQRVQPTVRMCHGTADHRLAENKVRLTEQGVKEDRVNF